MLEISTEELERIENSVDLHLGRYVMKKLKTYGDDINQIELSTDASETNASVLLRSIRVAQELTRRGLGLGDTLVVCATTHNDVSIPIIASLYIGCSVLTLSTTMSKTEVRNMLVLGETSLVFCDADMSQIFSEILLELNCDAEVVVFGDEPLDGKFVSFKEFLKPTGTENEFEVTDFDPKETIIFISCSSGTTGLPKGICHTHKSFGLGLLLVSSANKTHPENVTTLSFSSLYWASGLYNLMNSCVHRTTRINCALPFSVELFDKALKIYKPSSAVLSPVAMCEILKHHTYPDLDFSCLKLLFVGGSPTSPTVMAEMQKKMSTGYVCNGYGMTEVGSVANNMQGTPGSCGKINPWIQWRIVDPDTGMILGPNKTGELQMKSAALFHSYYKNPVATAQAYDADGWFKSGDQVYYDENKLIFFVDRIKEVMKYRNYQITPAELEFEIMKVPNVVQVAVVGKHHPEDGEHPMAFVQKVEGSDLTAQDIKDALKNTLSDIKQLRGGVVFLKNLPSTPSGKVHRKHLKKLALEVKGE